MKKAAYITGTGSGIGKALAELLLEEHWKVVGISRHHPIQHPNYKAIVADLSKPDAYQESQWFGHLKTHDEVVLVNNAGTIHPISRAGHYPRAQVIEALHLNLLAPILIANAFLQALNPGQKAALIQISSGAAWNPYSGWGVYCSTKAGLDMLGKVIEAEKAESQHPNLRVFNIAPGVVDTPMQEAIRKAEPEQFSSLPRFLELHTSKKLKNSQTVATEIFEIIASGAVGQNLDIRL